MRQLVGWGGPPGTAWCRSTADHPLYCTRQRFQSRLEVADTARARAHTHTPLTARRAHTNKLVANECVMHFFCISYHYHSQLVPRILAPSFFSIGFPCPSYCRKTAFALLTFFFRVDMLGLPGPRGGLVYTDFSATGLDHRAFGSR